MNYQSGYIVSLGSGDVVSLSSLIKNHENSGSLTQRTCNFLSQLKYSPIFGPLVKFIFVKSKPVKNEIKKNQTQQFLQSPCCH